MATRASKALLVFAVAIFYSLVVLNNTTDPNSNLQFVRHTLSMDTTFPGNRGMWRAIHAPWVYLLFFLSIVAWEIVTCVLCWWGGFRLVRDIKSSAAAFNAAKRVSIVAFTLGLLMWLLAFLSVGGEWFLMWQSAQWNGQEPATRMFTVMGIVLLYLAIPDVDGEA
jgi:predicted small integral membrane protein